MKKLLAYVPTRSWFSLAAIVALYLVLSRVYPPFDQRDLIIMIIAVTSFVSEFFSLRRRKVREAKKKAERSYAGLSD